MMLRLIADVNKALEAESYFSALSLVLTFPDICGKAEYPQEKSTAKRYKNWYDEYIVNMNSALVNIVRILQCLI